MEIATEPNGTVRFSTQKNLDCDRFTLTNVSLSTFFLSRSLPDLLRQLAKSKLGVRLVKEQLTIYNVPKDLLAEFVDKAERSDYHEGIVQAIIDLMEKLVVEKEREVKVVYS